MGATFWLLLCLLLTFASATGDIESPARAVQQLIEADELFWAWAQFFAVICECQLLPRVNAMTDPSRVAVGAQTC